MLLLFVAANFAAAGLGARIGDRGPESDNWFARLRKPPDFPSPRIFAPVWVAVCVFSGLGGWGLWREWRQGGAGTALVLYALALAGGIAWQGVSLGLRQLGMGLAWGLAALATLGLAILAGRQAPASAWNWLSICWVWQAYAAHLNFELWRLNRAGRPSPEDVQTGMLN